MKQRQDLEIPPGHHYIWLIVEIDNKMITEHEEDVFDKVVLHTPFHMILCMSKAGSERLLQAQYIQSDIGFKHVVGFYEFELACMDRDTNTSM